MIVNYVRECTAFIAYASDNKITANEFVLWHALFNAINQRAVSSEWPDGFIPVSNSRLLSLTTFGAGKNGEETLRKTRDRLIQRGLLRYMAGLKNKRNPAYQMVFFFANCDAEADVTQEKRGNMPGNTTGNVPSNMQGRTPGIVDKPYGNPTETSQTKKNYHRQSFTRARGEYVRADGTPAPTRYDRAYQTSEVARRAIAQRLLDGFGGQIDTDNAHAVLCERMRQGLPPELIEDVSAECATSAELETRLFGLAVKLGLTDDQKRRELAQCRLAAAGNEQLAQALYRMRTGYGNEAEG
jgi:hypothetical protein